MHVLPFELNLGWCPTSYLDSVSKAGASSIESVNELKRHLAASSDVIRFAHRLAEARFSSYNARRYKPQSYKVGDKVWLSKDYFTDAVAMIQESRTLGVKKYGPFVITDMIRKNVVRLSFPTNTRCHPVLHIEHTLRFLEYPSDIAAAMVERLTLLPASDTLSWIEFEKISSPWRQGKRYHWLALPRGASQPDAQWQKTGAFLDADGAITEVFPDYFLRNRLLSHLH